MAWLLSCHVRIQRHWQPFLPFSLFSLGTSYTLRCLIWYSDHKTASCAIAWGCSGSSQANNSGCCLILHITILFMYSQKRTTSLITCTYVERTRFYLFLVCLTFQNLSSASHIYTLFFFTTATTWLRSTGPFLTSFVESCFLLLSTRGEGTQQLKQIVMRLLIMLKLFLSYCWGLDESTGCPLLIRQ